MTVRLHRRSAGPPDAPPLLLGGSLGPSLGMWHRQLPLSEQLRMIRLDHRGHGSSPVPPGPYTIAELGADVVALMGELELERASFAGLSIGGMVGMWLGANAPERIDRLVLLNTTAWMPTASVYEERATRIRAEGSTESIADEVVERWLTPDYAAEHPDVRARLRAMVAATSAEGYAGCCDAIAAMDLREELGRIRAPTLVISGAEDPATPVELQEAIAAAIPDARHEVVNDAAHLSAVQQPERINELIGEHLR
jgi:3-oxoadipate enol-lactonase